MKDQNKESFTRKIVPHFEKAEKLQKIIEQEQEFLEAMRDYDDRLAVEFEEAEFDFDYADYGCEDED